MKTLDDPRKGEPRASPISLSGTNSEVLPCGTWAAYKRHMKRGEPPCEPCRQASRSRSLARYRKRDRAIRRARYVSRARDFGVADCAECGATFSKVNRAHIRCSDRCRNRRRRAQTPSIAPGEPESPAPSGSPATLILEVDHVGL